MSLYSYRITAKVKQDEVLPSLSEDFELAADGTIPVDALLGDPHLTLYCASLGKPEVYFVRTAQVLDGNEHAFFYQAQYRQAQQLVVVPFEQLHRVARSMRFDQRSVIFLHSTGRCGSTLLSRVFAALPGVHSISEPDVFTLLNTLRPPDHSRDAELAQLCESCVKLLCKPVGRPVTRTVLKGRSQIMEVADLLWQGFSEAPTLFVYREAMSWLNSFLRALFQGASFNDEENREWEARLLPVHPIIAEFRRAERPLSPGELWVLDWVSSMESYLRLQEHGLRGVAVRYEDLKRQPLVMVEALLKRLGLAAPPRADLKAVLDSDSQAGTELGRDVVAAAPAVAAHYFEQARDIIASRPLLREPDFVIPDTLVLD